MQEPILATKTMAAIEVALEADQGARYRQYLKELLPQQDDAYRGQEEWQRKHLGASMIGRPCGRELWYNFRWVKEKKFEGRILRLFNRGHLEEARMVAALLIIDCEVWQLDENGHQFKISDIGGHFASAIDGVVRGIPDMPGVSLLAEYKTHGDKSFQKVKADGVRKSKFEHYVQMNQYMGDYHLTHALYGAVNKNDDELYFEIVPFDLANYQAFRQRAAEIIHATTPPERVNRSPSWYQCKFCDFSDICHKGAPVERSCRTCQYVEPLDDGTWICRRDNTILDKQAQIKGCDHFTLNPDIHK